MSTSELLAAVTAGTKTKLTALDFRKRSGSLFTVPINDVATGWVGLNHAAASRGLLEVNPMIGLRFEPLEKMISQLDPESKLPATAPTLSSSLGYLMPEQRYRPWFFNTSNIEDGTTDLVSAIKIYAMPFMEQHSTLVSIIEGIRSGLVTLAEQRAKRLVVALLLASDSPGALTELDSFCASLGDRSDSVANSFHDFSARVRDEFELGKP